MNRVLGIYKTLIVFVSVLSISGASFGQDLGSTSGLFRAKATTQKVSTTNKKSTPKRISKRSRSTSSSATKAPVKRASSKSSSTGKNANLEIAEISKSESNATASAQIAAKRSNKLDDDIIITVGGTTPGNDSELFENALAEGNIARDKRQYVEAEEAYARAIKLNPADSRALYGLGNIFSDQQRWEAAEVSYRKALELEPTNPSANVALSYVLTQPVIGSNLGERYGKAEEIARKAIELAPKSAIAYDQLGVALELRGIISIETEQAYETAIKLDPKFALAYAHLGRLMRKRGRTNESSEAYRKAINLAVGVPMMILVADVMQSQQRYLDSEQLLREALRRDPRNPTALYLLGRALITRKSFKEAEAILTMNLSVSPQSFVSYTMLGSLYSQSGDLNKAEQTLNSAKTFASDNEKKRLSQEFESIGDAMMRAGRNLDAVRVYQSAISLVGEKRSLKVKLAIAESRK